MIRRQAVPSVVIAVAMCLGGVVPLSAQTTGERYEPKVGQPGKDAVWVPTPEATIEVMLDFAAVTPQDYVIDLGSGDGRAIIAAAKRGARALGVEYNEDLVELSKRHAAEQGVADKATFVQGDMYVADISKATVLALFLLPENLRKLTPNFLALPPDTRIVVNTFGIPGWEPDERTSVQGECLSWCEVLLYYVPARVEGTWQLPEGTLTLTQDAQEIAGTLQAGENNATVEQGRMRGSEIRFMAGGVEYRGRVTGDVIEGVATSDGTERRFTARRGAR